MPKKTLGFGVKPQLQEQRRRLRFLRLSEHNQSYKTALRITQCSATALQRLGVVLFLSRLFGYLLRSGLLFARPLHTFDLIYNLIPLLSHSSNQLT